MNGMRSELTPFLDAVGRLLALPAKHRKKLLALWYLAGKVEAGRQYTEAELLSEIDLIDSRMEIYAEALQDLPVGSFSNRIFALDKKIYRHG